MADEPAPTAVEPVRLQFHYIKGPAYREAACHGVIGGATPQRKLWMSFYSERYPLPRMVEYDIPRPNANANTVSFDERAVEPVHTDTRTGVIRHVEFSAYLDLEAAERLHDWLAKQIRLIKGEGTAP